MSSAIARLKRCSWLRPTGRRTPRVQVWRSRGRGRRGAAGDVAREERSRIEPETGKDGRAVDPIRAWRQHRRMRPLSQDEPEDLVRLDRPNDVLQNASPLVVVELRPEVDVPGRVGDLDEQARERHGRTAARSSVRPPYSGKMRSSTSGCGSLFQPRIVVALSRASTPGCLAGVVVEPYDRLERGLRPCSRPTGLGM